MACYRPIVAFKPCDGGPVIFSEKKDHVQIELPCGKCIGCRIRKREEWAVRIYAEAQMHEKKIFATITYDEEHIPRDYGLNYADIQRLNKRLRKKFGPFRFFVAGEYGDQFGRPHYHAIYFGLRPDDLRKCNSLYSRFDLYESTEFDKCWARGKVAIGEVTYQSARYCATYTTKRITGEIADEHYERVSPLTGEIRRVPTEFAKMSLKPGLGQTWLEKYWPEVYQAGHGAVIIDGKKKVIPRFFDKKLDSIAPMVLEGVQFDRYQEAMKYGGNNTPERLAVREECAHARHRFQQETKL